jgi:acetyl-CoA/propionyl-CoA carboxylase biotin carboxyl carrier protein
MIAKLIVTGATRNQAAQRARRALEEYQIEGMPTVLPFHRAVMADEAFTPVSGPFTVHTRWIETEFATVIEPHPMPMAEAEEADERTSVTVEVAGKRLEVTLPSSLGSVSATADKSAKKKRKPGRKAGAAAAGNSAELRSPMQGTIVKVAVANGDTVAAGDLIVVLEAMKMEQPITAHRAGTVQGLEVSPGESLSSGAVIASIIEAD